METEQGRTVSLAALVKQRREDLGLTVVDAAHRAGVSRSTWHEIESGRRTTTIGDTMQRIEAALELDRGTLRLQRAPARPGTATTIARAAPTLAMTSSNDVVPDDDELAPAGETLRASLARLAQQLSIADVNILNVLAKELLAADRLREMVREMVQEELGEQR